MKPSLSLALLVVLTASSIAQTSSGKTTKPQPARTGALSKEIQALRDTVTAQQQQMEVQRQQMDQLKTQLQQLLDATQQANANSQKVQGERRAGANHSGPGPAVRHRSSARRRSGLGKRNRGEISALRSWTRSPKTMTRGSVLCRTSWAAFDSVATSGCVGRTSFRIARPA